MSGRYDSILKDILEPSGMECLTWMDLPGDSAQWIDTDLSTVSTVADKVLLVEGKPRSWILHLELQADHDLSLPDRLFRYAGILRARHELDVNSTVVLLRPSANASNLTGSLINHAPGGERTEFRYRVIRLWEQPVASILSGGVGLLTLAPLSDVREADLPTVIGVIKDRLDEVEPALAEKLWLSLYVLMGLCWSHEIIERTFTGGRIVKSSVTYQKIVQEGIDLGLEKGRMEGVATGLASEARALLLRMGKKKFGDFPTKAFQEKIAALELKELEELAEKILDHDSWESLFFNDSANS